jgi:hypothetical protein
MKGGGLSGDLYRFCARFRRLARFERNRENSIYPLIFRVFLHWGHVAEWLRSGLQNSFCCSFQSLTVPDYLVLLEFSEAFGPADNPWSLPILLSWVPIAVPIPQG